jgi:catechol 2,3-dioxygenase-like lactoylglutathione lyase family enzyme
MPHRLIWSILPVLPYENAELTLAFYGRIGFEVAHMSADYIVFQRDGLELHLARPGDLAPPGAASCYLRTPNVDLLHAQFRESLDGEIAAVVDMPWQMRELRLRDPFGNLLRFGQPSSE